MKPFPTLSQVLAYNIVFGLLLVIVVSIEIYSDRQSTIKLGFEYSQSLNSTLAEKTRQIIGSTKESISAYASVLAEDLQLSTSRADLLTKQIGASERKHSSVISYYIVDASGRRIASTATTMSTQFMQDAPEVKALLGDHTRSLYVSPARPIAARDGSDDLSWAWIIAVPIKAGGVTTGLVAAEISVNYLSSSFEKLPSGARGAAGLYTSLGDLIVRVPQNELLLAVNLAKSAVYQASKESDVAQMLNVSIDGIQRIVSTEHLPEFDVYVYTGLATDDVLAPWKARSIVAAGLALLAFAFSLGMSVVAYKISARNNSIQAERARRGRVLAESSVRIVQSQTLDEVIQTGLAFAVELSGSTVGVAQIYQDGPQLYAFPEGEPVFKLKRHSSIAAVENALEPYTSDRTSIEVIAGVDPLESAAIIPIAGRDGTLIGNIQVASDRPGYFGEADLNELVQLVSIISSRLENLRLDRERENNLRQAGAARAQLQAILASITDAVYAVDRGWNIVYLNSGAARVMGKPAGELVGKNLWSEFPALFDTVLHDAYMRAIATGEHVSFEMTYPVDERAYFISAFPHQEGVTVYFRDISDERELQMRVHQNEKMTAIGQLTGGIAHDFNNLLTVILGCIESLLENESLKDGPRAQLLLTQTAGLRAAELVHRLLAFARRQPLKSNANDVEALLTSMLPLAKVTLGASIELQFSSAPNLFLADIDGNEMENAVLNLLLNSRDAINGAGKITIEAFNELIDDHNAKKLQLAAGDYVVVSVSDSGKGMSLSHVAQAFEPFFTTKAPGMGSGLGLSMVYGFVRQSGGNVEIYSEEGVGTTVKMYLPKAETSSFQGEVDIKPPLIKGGAERILLVEDNDLVRAHAFASLEKLGYEVSMACDALDAIRLLDSGLLFDALLTDIVLPGGQTGRAVADYALKIFPDLKVVFMSGYNGDVIFNEGQLDQDVVFLNKPFRLDELDMKLRQAIEGASGFAAAH